MKTIFITGASTGLLFYQKGSNMIATIPRPEKETELGQLDNITLLPLDVTDRGQISDTVQKAFFYHNVFEYSGKKRKVLYRRVKRLCPGHLQLQVLHSRSPRWQLSRDSAFRLFPVDEQNQFFVLLSLLYKTWAFCLLTPFYFLTLCTHKRRV